MIQDTSLQGYDEIKETLGDKQRKVLEYMNDRYGDFTNSELSVGLGWTINRVTPRIFELRHTGKVELSQKRACKVTGRTAMAWKVIK